MSLELSSEAICLGTPSAHPMEIFESFLYGYKFAQRPIEEGETEVRVIPSRRNQRVQTPGSRRLESGEEKGPKLSSQVPSHAFQFPRYFQSRSQGPVLSESGRPGLCRLLEEVPVVPAACHFPHLLVTVHTAVV